MPAVALTDHGTLGGAVQFYRAAQEEGVKPIIGLELYVATDRRARAGVKERNAHLTLLARDETGYRNLVKLSTPRYLEGYYYKPRADWELLERAPRGPHRAHRLHERPHVACCCATATTTPALAEVAAPGGAVGPENVYVELQDAGLPEQRELLPKLARLAEQAGLRDRGHQRRPLPAPRGRPRPRRPALHPDAEQPRRRGPHALRQRRVLPQVAREEMDERFADYPGACDATVEIAERCDVSLEFGGYLLPALPGAGRARPRTATCASSASRASRAATAPIPAPEVQRAPRVRARRHRRDGLRRLLPHRLGLRQVRQGQRHRRRPRPRLGGGQHRRATRSASPTSTRSSTTCSSSASSTRGARACPTSTWTSRVARRDEVIEYVADKYGRDRVAQIITFGTMAARAATRDAARVMGLPYAVGDSIAKMIPEQAPPATFDAGHDAGRRAAARPTTPTQQVKEVVDLAMASRASSATTPSTPPRVVISDQPLTEYVPLQQKGDAELVTQFDMNDVAKLGLLKMDFLGLRNLDVIEAALEHHREEPTASASRSTSCRSTTQKTYEMLARGDSTGVFQFESGGMREALREVGPTQFEDLIAIVALYRPGPMQYIPTYARNKQDPASVVYDHEALRPILEPTHGVTIYQEQYMAIARRVGGFTPGAGRRPAQGHQQEGQEADGHPQGAAHGGPRAAAACRRPWPTSCGPASRPPATTRSTRATPPATR